MIIVTVGVLTLRLVLQEVIQSTFPVGSLIGALANAFSILILNVIYKKIALWLTEWGMVYIDIDFVENHRTESKYSMNLIFKLFLFQFANSYTSLYYVAFFKDKRKLWNSDQYQDQCTDLLQQYLGLKESPCIGELMIQLGTLIVADTVLGKKLKTIEKIRTYYTKCVTLDFE